MKKILLIALVFILLFTSVACDNKNEKTSEPKETTAAYTTSTRQTIAYPKLPQNSPSSTPIIVYTCLSYTNDEKVFTLSDEDSDIIKSLLNELEWEPHITKTAYEYVLELPDKIIYYSPEANMLNNKIDFIHVKLSDEQNELMKSILGYEKPVPTIKK